MEDKISLCEVIRGFNSLRRTNQTSSSSFYYFYSKFLLCVTILSLQLSSLKGYKKALGLESNGFDELRWLELCITLRYSLQQVYFVIPMTVDFVHRHFSWKCVRKGKVIWTGSQITTGKTVSMYIWAYKFCYETDFK